ncbi:MAG TPA: membrane protein insertase YidC [Streptosporangiaceae bacterium]|jgi:YidC/Oxa1 family membrane protein insertase|nr:membrane protein insertase YidC [Streptosporangiaceae bacterium]
MFSVLGVAVTAAYHVVSAFAQALAPLGGGLAAAAAIVMFTVAVRLLLLPLSYYTIRGQASQARLAPQVQALRQRHAGHPDRLQRELAALYQRERGGMFAGCLPLLLQLPFLSVMYTLFRSATVGGRPNSLLRHDLFGAALGSHWLSAPGPLSVQGAVFLGLFALLAAAGWLAARVTRALAARQPAATPAPGRPVPPGQAGGLMGWVARVLPYTTVAVAAVMPLAAGLYLLTTTAWGAGERTVLGRRLARAQPAVAAPARPGRSAPARAGRSGPARTGRG